MHRCPNCALKATKTLQGFWCTACWAPVIVQPPGNDGLDANRRALVAAAKAYVDRENQKV